MARASDEKGEEKGMSRSLSARWALLCVCALRAVPALELELGASPRVLALLNAEPDALEFGAPAARTAARQPPVVAQANQVGGGTAAAAASSPQGATVERAGASAAAPTEPETVEARFDAGGSPSTPQPRFVRLNVDIGVDRKESLVARAGDDLEARVADFCTEHQLDYAKAAPTILNGLRDLLDRAAKLELDDGAAAKAAKGAHGGSAATVGAPGAAAGAVAAATDAVAPLPFSLGTFRLASASLPLPPAAVTLRVESANGEMPPAPLPLQTRASSLPPHSHPPCALSLRLRHASSLSIPCAHPPRAAPLPARRRGGRND